MTRLPVVTARQLIAVADRSDSFSIGKRAATLFMWCFRARYDDDRRADA